MDSGKGAWQWRMEVHDWGEADSLVTTAKMCASVLWTIATVRGHCPGVCGHTHMARSALKEFN